MRVSSVVLRERLKGSVDHMITGPFFFDWISPSAGVLSYETARSSPCEKCLRQLRNTACKYCLQGHDSIAGLVIPIDNSVKETVR